MLRHIRSTLPPGFGFYPSDQELLFYYLYSRKVTGEPVPGATLIEVDLHASDPWDLPDEAELNAKEWYFFTIRNRRYSTGCRANRATRSGYWKATGKDRQVQDPSTPALVGMRKTLVFYAGRAPNGVKTGWVMHEFRLEIMPHTTPPQEDWVLCRVFLKTEGESLAYGTGRDQQGILVGTSSIDFPSNSSSGMWIAQGNYGTAGSSLWQMDTVGSQHGGCRNLSEGPYASPDPAKEANEGTVPGSDDDGGADVDCYIESFLNNVDHAGG